MTWLCKLLANALFSMILLIQILMCFMADPDLDFAFSF